MNYYKMADVLALFRKYSYGIYQLPSGMMLACNEMYCVAVMPVKRYFSCKLSFTVISFKFENRDAIIEKYYKISPKDNTLWGDYMCGQLPGTPYGKLAMHHASYIDIENWLLEEAHHNNSIKSKKKEYKYIAWPCQCGCVHYMKDWPQKRYFYDYARTLYVICEKCGIITYLSKEPSGDGSYTAKYGSTSSAIYNLYQTNSDGEPMAKRPLLIVSGNYINIPLQSGKDAQWFNGDLFMSNNFDPQADHIVNMDILKMYVRQNPEVLNAIRECIASDSFTWPEITESYVSDATCSLLLDAVDTGTLNKVSLTYKCADDTEIEERYYYDPGEKTYRAEIHCKDQITARHYTQEQMKDIINSWSESHKDATLEYERMVQGGTTIRIKSGNGFV